MLVFSPDFIGIGFRRCASSWLHLALSEHPEISKPRSGLHFFSNEENYKNGLSWYKKQICSHNKSAKRFGEFSVSYTYPDLYHIVINRIAKDFFSVPLFCIVRNPIDRAYSDYQRSLNRKEIPRSMTFEKAIETYPEFLERGLYGAITRQYNMVFKKDVKIFYYEDLLSDPKKFISEVYSFIKVDPLYIPSNIENKMGTAYQIKYNLFDSIVTFSKRSIGYTLKKYCNNTYYTLKKNRINKYIGNVTKKERESIRSETKMRLIEYFKDDISLLQSITKEDLSHWIK